MESIEVTSSLLIEWQLCCAAKYAAEFLQASPSPIFRSYGKKPTKFTLRNQRGIACTWNKKHIWWGQTSYIAIPEIKPLPVCNKLNNMPLPSSSINNMGLYPIEDVLEVYEHYITQKNNPTTVAQILAKEAVFGTHLMEQCTPTGTKVLRALPQQGLMKHVPDTVFSCTVY